ncbi:hypothetical protein [Bradyrhizobium sp.]|uniref:hypothetical protein n=1 Tax=Bradyrhizobium sp. TaxID=376 RepID=UPI002625516F|nr:hypothetical protein [Bradyrhizobium sp.]
MRVLPAVGLLTLLVAGPAFAQIKPPAASDPPKTPGQIETEKSADQAYKNSLRNIPDKPAADPWGGAHAMEGSSSASTTPTRRTKSSY